jgi:hypothetical protein
MTTITIPDAILSQIQPGEQAVEVCDATGRLVGYFAPVATAEDYRKTKPPVSDDELDRRSKAGGGRSLTEILADLQSDRP